MAILPPDPKYIFRGDMGCVHSVLFRVNPEVEHLFAGNSTGTVYIWNLKTNRELLRLPSGKDSCLSLQSITDEDLIVQHKCGLIKSYRIAESGCVLEKTFDTDFCHYCRFQVLFKDKILVPLKKSIVGVLSMKTLNLEFKLDPSGLPFFEKLGEAMVIAPVKNESQMVLIGYEGGQLILWDVREKSALSRLGIESSPMALDFDASAMKGIVGGPSDQLQVFNLSASHTLSDRIKLTLKNPGTSVVTIRQDAKIVAVGGWDNRVRIFSWKSLRPLASLDQHRDTVHDIAYSLQKVEAYDNKILMATAGKDGRVAVWDIYN